MSATQQVNGIDTRDERKEPIMRSISGLALDEASVSARTSVRRRTPRRIFGALCLGLIAVAAGACEGDNLFSSDTPELLPRVSNLSAPATAVAGDTISVRVDAYAPHGVAQIAVSVEGAVTRDTIVEITTNRTQVSQTVRVPVPPVVSDTLLTVRASVADKLGNVSLTRTTQVVAYGPPTISSVLAPVSVRANDVVNIEVKAAGVRRITRVDYHIRGALSRDTSISVQPAQTNVAQDLTFQVPAIVSDTIVNLSIVAWDEAALASVSKNVQIPLAIDPPVLTLQAPSFARAGDRLDVKVSASGMRKISQVRIQLRGAADMDTTVNLNPTQNSFTQSVAMRLPAAITSSDLEVHAFVIDVGGANSATQSVDVYIPIDPPEILDMDLPGEVLAGQTLDVLVYASGSLPLRSVEVRFRLAVDVPAQSYVIPADPPQYSFEQPVSLVVPQNPKEQVLLVEARAIDAAYQASSPWVSRTVTVTIPDPASGAGSQSASSALPPAPKQTVKRLETLRGAGSTGEGGAQTERTSNERP